MTHSFVLSLSAFAATIGLLAIAKEPPKKIVLQETVITAEAFVDNEDFKHWDCDLFFGEQVGEAVVVGCQNGEPTLDLLPLVDEH
jgi:hypothetical protein